MYNVDLDRNDSLKYEIYDILINKKNMMFYDGLSDELDENIRYKFFYSSPYDAFEFINIDIYGNNYSICDCKESIDFYGVIYITRESRKLEDYKSNTDLGEVIIQDIVIRDIEKQIVKLYINKNGVSCIENTIEYFENNLCIK